MNRADATVVAAVRTTLLVLVAAVGGACAPIVRPPPFVGARDQVTDATLIGPFDGVVIDESSDEPIADAVVVGLWSYDAGDGFIGPQGSEVFETTTDKAGRYRISSSPLKIRGRTVRLVAFHLFVYKRGFLGYRSDLTPDGLPRKDFYVRQNRVALRKWRETDSHSAHLLYLGYPRELAQSIAWEHDLANTDLYRALGGRAAVPGIDTAEPGTPATRVVLDAGKLLEPTDVRRRTGYTEAFEVKELGDFAREPFYHGVHLQAAEREEDWDVAYRVWKSPPGGLDTVKETLEATLPGVQPSAEVTDETWVYDTKDVRAVGFLDRERDVGVLLTCGGSQCIDIETAIILAKVIQDNLDDLRTVEITNEPQVPPPATPTEAEPGTGDEEHPEQDEESAKEPLPEGTTEDGPPAPASASTPTRGRRGAR